MTQFLSINLIQKRKNTIQLCKYHIQHNRYYSLKENVPKRLCIRKTLL